MDMTKKEEENELLPVNAGLMPADLVEKLDVMCAEDETKRTGFIRKLIRQEWARRQQNLLAPVDSGKKAVINKQRTSVAA